MSPVTGISTSIITLTERIPRISELEIRKELSHIIKSIREYNACIDERLKPRFYELAGKLNKYEHIKLSQEVQEIARILFKKTVPQCYPWIPEQPYTCEPSKKVSEREFDPSSAIPLDHQKLFISLADAIQMVCHAPKYQHAPIMKICSEILYDILIDMNFTIYQDGYGSVACFCDSLINSLPANFVSRYIQLQRDNSRSENIRYLQEEGVDLLREFQTAEILDEIGQAFIKQASHRVEHKKLKSIIQMWIMAEQASGKKIFGPVLEQYLNENRTLDLIKKTKTRIVKHLPLYKSDQKNP